MASKAGSFDDTVILDHPRRAFPGELVAALRAGRAGAEPQFLGVDAQSFNATFREQHAGVFASSSFCIKRVTAERRRAGRRSFAASKSFEHVATESSTRR